ncbi:uncharacterized protein LOC134815435 [Bolinopsis microptera]|uniref:uncharacterized protein LOC134815433 n=1 Tax=Bolinopsis microptera TaxID=2820187 RepID=UPI003079D695
MNLQNKFTWLLSKYYPPPPPTPPTVIQPAADRVTTLNCDSVSDNQKSVLALGPNFAVTPHVNQEFKDKVSMDIAQCVFKIRHKQAFEQQPVEQSMDSEEQPNNTPEHHEEAEEAEEPTSKKIKRICPFPTPFTRTPDPACPELEDKLAYKCGEFVVTTKDIHRTLTEKHLEETAVYLQILPTRKVRECFRNTIPLEQVKVRPIISCVDSPTERLSWLVTTILKPLLKEIPSHLGNLFEHLETLRAIPKEQLAGRRIFSADISALYTNINVQGCIDDVIELATEHREKLDLMGLNLTDVHEILLHILTSSYFVYNGTLWIQQDGLFMGLRPGPFCAVIRVYKFERSSVYTDLHYLSVYLSDFYKRYIDDATSTAVTREEALALVQSIADQDPDKKLKWEVEFPENDQEFIPFLNTELRVEPDGTVTSRLYRKPQQKDITLHKNSCHPESVKTNTVINLYKEADKIS